MVDPDRSLTAASSRYRLRLPGPTAVPERVRQAMALPVLNHRGPEFRALLTETEARLRPLFGTDGPVLPLCCSGTGAMEAALANLVAPGDPVLAVIHGQFGERFAQIGEALGAAVERVEFPWGEGIDPDAVAARARRGGHRAVLVTHNESSTGAVADLAGLGDAMRGLPALVVVDSVSGLGGMEVQQDAWGLDVVVSASQKALMCPPGLGLVSLAPRAVAAVRAGRARPGYAWNLNRALDAAAKSETPFTPAVSLIAALHEALAMIHAEGLPRVFRRHRRLATALRRGGAAMGLHEFTRAPILSDTVVVFGVPAGLDGGAIVRGLYERHRTVIAGSRSHLSGRVVRVGTMGDLDEAAILTDLLQIEDVLGALGHAPPAGAGVAAAAAFLADPAPARPLAA